MGAEVGQILTGKVTGITKFGAFVDLSTGETGMVHISEVSNSFVNEIGEFVKLNDEVKVKVLSVGENKKISLSMKQAVPSSKKPAPKRESKPKYTPADNQNGADYVWAPRKDDLSFEEMMNKFKQSSEEKMSDLKKSMEVKKSSSRRR